MSILYIIVNYCGKCDLQKNHKIKIKIKEIFNIPNVGYFSKSLKSYFWLKMTIYIAMINTNRNYSKSIHMYVYVGNLQFIILFFRNLIRIQSRIEYNQLIYSLHTSATFFKLKLNTVNPVVNEH